MKLEVPNHKTRKKSEGRMTNYSRSIRGDHAHMRGAEIWLHESTGEGGFLREEPSGGRPPYDLEERTARFGEEIIKFAKKIPRNPINSRLIEQLVGAGTSVGANYCEANDGVSKKDFRHKIGICRKESKETKHWLRMVATAEPELKTEARKLWCEAKELNLIFGAIWRKP